jgi:hypothetical protein
MTLLSGIVDAPSGPLTVTIADGTRFDGISSFTGPLILAGGSSQMRGTAGANATIPSSRAIFAGGSMNPLYTETIGAINCRTDQAPPSLPDTPHERAACRARRRSVTSTPWFDHRS